MCEDKIPPVSSGFRISHSRFFIYFMAFSQLAPISKTLGCTTTYNVGQAGQPYATIQSAINAIPANLAQDTCVIIRDTQTYSEQVTIQGISVNGHRITIQPDPSFISSAPVVSPPQGSTAAFSIRNDSVTIQNLTVSAPNTVSYGILSSSNFAVLDSIQINDAPAGNIQVAGVSISSYSTVSNSTIQVLFPNALVVSGRGSLINHNSLGTLRLNPSTGIDLNIVKADGLAVIDNTLIGGVPCIYISGSTNTVIASNAINLTEPPFGLALQLTDGSSGLTLSSNTVNGPVLINAGNQGHIEILNNNINASFSFGLKILGQLPSTDIWITSNVIVFPHDGNAGFGIDVFGIYLQNLPSGATVQSNGVFQRNVAAWFMDGHTIYDLYMETSAGLVVEHNRFSNPGIVVEGSYEAAHFRNTTNSRFAFNDLQAWVNPGAVLNNAFLLSLDGGSSNIQVKNNIFSSSFTVSGTSATISVTTDSQPGFASDYNDFFSFNNNSTGYWGSRAYMLISSWTANTGQDAHSISITPLWNNPTSGVEDFHPLSMWGRYDPASGTFARDPQTSATIDAGDPAAPFALEPQPNGGRVNQGSYGNTPEASMSAPPPPGAPILSGLTLSTATIRWSWTPSGGRPDSFSLFASSGMLVAFLPGSATFYLETGLSSGTLYSRYLMTANPLGQAFSSTVTIATPQLQSFLTGTSSGTLTSANGKTQLVIPPGNLAAGTSWLVSETPNQRPLTDQAPLLIAAANRTLPPALQGSTSSLTEFIVAVGGTRYTGPLPSPVTVKVPYPDANNTGFVDGTSPPVRVESLQLYVLNEGSGLWEAVPGSAVDKVNKVVSGQIGHLSIFNAFGAGAVPGLSTARVYPVPYKPNGGNADQGIPYSAGDPNSGIIFDNLPADVTIKIYDVAGRSVASFNSGNSTGKLRWDARNGAGKDVASGGYLAVISSPGVSSITKKILIVR